MFKKLLVAAALALAPVSGVAHAELSAAPAQQTDADAAFIAWLQVLNQHMERAGAAARPFLQLDMNFDPNDQAAAMALLRQISVMAGTARGELAAVPVSSRPCRNSPTQTRGPTWSMSRTSFCATRAPAARVSSRWSTT